MRTAAMFSLFALMCACCAGVRADECADWSRTPSLPHIEPSITGNVCRLDWSTAYVAGAEFMVVDVSVWDRPLVAGRVALPEAALDLAVAWPRAYAACGEAGLVELDLTEWEAPRIVRIYDPTQAVIKVIEIDGAVIALDAGSNLHVLALEAGGPLAARAVHAWSGAIRAMSKAGGFLVLANQSRIWAVNVRSPYSLSVAGYMNLPGYSYRTALAADGSRLYLVETYWESGSYVEGWTYGTTSYSVSSTGRIDKIREKLDFQDGGDAAAAAGGRLVTTGQPTYTDPLPTLIRDAMDLTLMARLPVSGRSLDLGPGLLVMVGASGLITIALPGTAEQVRSTPVQGDLDLSTGPSWNSTTAGALWTPTLGMLTTTKVHVDGHLWGYTSKSVQYTLYDGRDPRTWLPIASGSFSGGDSGDGYCGVPDLYLLDVLGERAIIIWRDSCTLRAVVCDVRNRQILGEITENCVEPGQLSLSVTGRILWVEGYSGRHCYDLLSAKPLAPIETVQLVREGTRLVADLQLLAVYVEATHEFDTYDMSDVHQVRYLATWTAPQGSLISNKWWTGRKLWYVSGAYLHVVDFADPANPVLISSSALPRQPIALAADGNRLVLHYWWYAGTWHNQLQVADTSVDGLVSLYPVCDIPDWFSQLVLSGDVLYGRVSSGLVAYNVGNPATPALIGRTLLGSGSLDVIGDNVVSGTILTPRDCRDLSQPRAIAIDVQPELKPGSPSGYEGPTLIPVVVRGAPGIDPAQLDPATVRFGPSGAAPVIGPAAKAQIPAYDDLPGSGDARFWFRLEETGITSATDEVRLTGRTFSGVDVLGIGHLNALPPVPADGGLDLAVSPNPFNPRTTLSFSLGATGPAQLVVYNLQGQRVRSLLDGMQPSGRVTVVWDGTGDDGKAVASGVYFARLSGGGKVTTQRLALVR